MKKIALLFLMASALLQAQNRSLTEDDYYRIVTLPVPQNIALEVGGLAVLPDGRLAASTRRGEVWLVEQCGWKGKQVGSVGVHAKQALVLVNYGNGSGLEIKRLSEKIQESVFEKFKIALATEVNIV
jgi:UDP-N-acetylenolpyruvoylglucosamine reductase